MCRLRRRALQLRPGRSRMLKHVHVNIVLVSLTYECIMQIRLGILTGFSTSDAPSCISYVRSTNIDDTDFYTSLACGQSSKTILALATTTGGKGQAAPSSILAVGGTGTVFHNLCSFEWASERQAYFPKQQQQHRCPLEARHPAQALVPVRMACLGAQLAVWW